MRALRRAFQIDVTILIIREPMWAYKHDIRPQLDIRRELRSATDIPRPMSRRGLPYRPWPAKAAPTFLLGVVNDGLVCVSA